MKNIFKKCVIAILAFTAAVCSAVFVCSCNKEDNDNDNYNAFAQMIVDAEQKVLETEEYLMTYSVSVDVSAGGYTERAASSADWAEIFEEGNKVQYYHIADGEKLYRTCGLDFTYNNYGELFSVEKSSGIQISAGQVSGKVEDYDGAEITLEEKDEECIYSIRFGKNEILKQLKKMPVGIGDVIDFDLSAIDFGDEIIIKCHVNNDGELYLTEIDDWKFSFKVQGITIDASMSMSLYIETDREKIDLPEVGRCLEYADYYTDEDNTLRWVKNYEDPQAAELVSDIDYIKSYKVENYGKEFGFVAGDSNTGNIAAASCDDLELFSYVDIYDKDMRKTQTLCLRGAVEKVRINKNYISLNLKETSLDGSSRLTLAVVDLDDCKIVYKINLPEMDDYNAELFGNAFVYWAPTSDNGSNRVMKIYNIERDEFFTPTFDGNPLSGLIHVNPNGNILTSSGWNTLEINDLGEVIASHKRTVHTYFGSFFIGKYFREFGYYDSDKDVYYNAEEEISDIDIGEHPENWKVEFLFVDDSYAVFYDGVGGCNIYDFANREYLFQDSDWSHGIIDCHFYLGSAKWLTANRYMDCLYVYGV